MKKWIRQTTLWYPYCIVSCIVLLCGISIASAQVMQSSNYQIESDSINFAGGRSTSSSYLMEDTLGEIATGRSGSSNFNLHAGYQQLNESYIAITGGTDIDLTPTLGGITGGTATGSMVLTVTTDNSAGYEMSIEASSTPAMQHMLTSATIPDYVPAGDPDFVFGTTTNGARFGFSPEGTDISDRFKDNGAACNTGAGDTSLACWDGLSTTPAIIAERGSLNHPSGTDTTLQFRVGIDANANVDEGTYVATTTVTVVAL